MVLPFSPLAHRTQVRGKNILVSVLPGQSVAVENLPEGALPIGSFAISRPGVMMMFLNPGRWDSEHTRPQESAAHTTILMLR
jgi:hypothetical protein